MIISRDLITSLGLELKGNDLSIKWDDAAIPWHDMDASKEDLFLSEDPSLNEPIEQELQCMTDILDAKYAKADLRKVAESTTHLSSKERGQLHTLL